MSELYDFIKNGVSDCCSGKVYEGDICGECKEHCTAVDESDEDEKMRTAVMDR